MDFPNKPFYQYERLLFLGVFGGKKTHFTAVYAPHGNGCTKSPETLSNKDVFNILLFYYFLGLLGVLWVEIFF